MSEGKQEPNWKEIATDLAQCVNLALGNLKAPGSGIIFNSETQEYKHWRDRFADSLERIPGVEVDRELSHSYDLNAKDRRKWLKNREKEQEGSKRQT